VKAQAEFSTISPLSDSLSPRFDKRGYRGRAPACFTAASRYKRRA
jgi:hypothetical protein